MVKSEKKHRGYYRDEAHYQAHLKRTRELRAKRRGPTPALRVAVEKAVPKGTRVEFTDAGLENRGRYKEQAKTARGVVVGWSTAGDFIRVRWDGEKSVSGRNYWPYELQLEGVRDAGTK